MRTLEITKTHVRYEKVYLALSWIALPARILQPLPLFSHHGWVSLGFAVALAALTFEGGKATAGGSLPARSALAGTTR